VINAIPNLQYHLQLLPNITDSTHASAQIVSQALDVAILLVSKKADDFKTIMVMKSRCFEMIVRLALDETQIVEITNKVIVSLVFIEN
jgi:hypothetical protein